MENNFLPFDAAAASINWLPPNKLTENYIASRIEEVNKQEQMQTSIRKKLQRCANPKRITRTKYRMKLTRTRSTQRMLAVLFDSRKKAHNSRSWTQHHHAKPARDSEIYIAHIIETVVQLYVRAHTKLHSINVVLCCIHVYVYVCVYVCLFVS